MSKFSAQLLLLRPLYWNCGNQPSLMSRWVVIPKWQLSHFIENTPRTNKHFSYQIQSDHYIYSSSSAVERMLLRNPERKANKLDEIWDLRGNTTTIKCFLSLKEVNSCFEHNVLLNSVIFLICSVQETWYSSASKHGGGDDGDYYCGPAWQPYRIPGQVCWVHARGCVSRWNYILILHGVVTSAARVTHNHVKVVSHQ